MTAAFDLSRCTRKKVRRERQKEWPASNMPARGADYYRMTAARLYYAGGALALLGGVARGAERKSEPNSFCPTRLKLQNHFISGSFSLEISFIFTSPKNHDFTASSNPFHPTTFPLPHPPTHAPFHKFLRPHALAMPCNILKEKWKNAKGGKPRHFVLTYNVKGTGTSARRSTRALPRCNI